jgi:hypothetical protein
MQIKLCRLLNNDAPVGLCFRAGCAFYVNFCNNIVTGFSEQLRFPVINYQHLYS